MPTIDIDGRGFTMQEAIADMWNRVEPLEAKGYHPTTSVEIVDVAKKEVVETFQLTDPEFKAHLMDGQKLKRKDPKQPGKYPFIARIRLEY